MRTHWVLVELRNFVNPVLAGIASFITAVWTAPGWDKMFTWPHGRFGLIVGGVLVAWGIAYFTLLRPRYSELARELGDTKQELGDVRHALQDTLDASLALLLADLRKADPETRVSAYSVEGNEFVLLSRHSINPTIEQRGRPAYPLDKGAIGEAWASGSVTRSDDVETREEWEAALVAEGSFTEEEARSLTMFARSIFAVRVDANEREKVGMIVLESETLNAFQDFEAAKVQRRGFYTVIVNTLRWHEHFPRAKDRKDELEGGSSDSRLSEPVWKTAPETAR